jgi:hypothetical protein
LSAPRRRREPICKSRAATVAETGPPYQAAAGRSWSASRRSCCHARRIVRRGSAQCFPLATSSPPVTMRILRMTTRALDVKPHGGSAPPGVCRTTTEQQRAPRDETGVKGHAARRKTPPPHTREPLDEKSNKMPDGKKTREKTRKRRIKRSRWRGGPGADKSQNRNWK